MMLKLKASRSCTDLFNTISDLFKCVESDNLNKISTILMQYEDLIKLFLCTTNVEYNTLLHCAAQKGYLDLVKLFLKYGADLHVKNAKGQTPKDVAKAECKQFLQYIEDLFDAVKIGDLDKVHSLLHKEDKETVQILLNLKNVEDYTLLLSAVENGHIDVARLLLDQ